MKCTFQKIDCSVKIIKLMVCGILKPIKFFNLVIVRHSTDSFQCITNWIAEVGTPINKYMHWPKLIQGHCECEVTLEDTLETVEYCDVIKVLL